MAFRRGQFKINGLDSEEFNTYITERPKRQASSRVVELKERPGNDSVVFDHAYYKNTTQTIKCYAKASDFERVPYLEQEITAWLDMGRYSDFEVYHDPHYIYQAIVTSAPAFTGTRKTGLMVPFSFDISLRPFKHSRTGRRWIKAGKAQLTTKKIELVNVEKYPSKPVISLYGFGDISIFINDEEYQLKNHGGSIVIDSQLEESYRITNGRYVSLDEKTAFKDFPVLPAGKMTVSWTGDVTIFEIQPRWWTKI